jgi:hypothetical protein
VDYTERLAALEDALDELAEATRPMA